MLYKGCLASDACCVVQRACCLPGWWSGKYTINRRTSLMYFLIFPIIFQISTVHDSLALKICNEVLKDPTSPDVRIYSKSLCSLELSKEFAKDLLPVLDIALKVMGRNSILDKLKVPLQVIVTHFFCILLCDDKHEPFCQGNFLLEHLT